MKHLFDKINSTAWQWFMANRGDLDLTKKEPARPGVETFILDRPSVTPVKSMFPVSVQLPWKANRKGSADYVWYEIVDCEGWEVCHFGGVPTSQPDDVEEMLRQVALILTTVNRSRVITIDGKPLKIEWFGEGSQDV